VIFGDMGHFLDFCDFWRKKIGEQQVPTFPERGVGGSWAEF
jgi:hypothetical protein